MSTYKKRKTDSDIELNEKAKKSHFEVKCSKQFLSVLCVYVAESNIGKTRAELFRKQLSKFGANIVSEFSRLVSHVVVAEDLTCERVCQILELTTEDTLDEFSHLVIVKTSWVSACLKAKSLVDTETYRLEWKDYVIKKVQKTTKQSAPEKVKEEKLSIKNKRPQAGTIWKAAVKKKRDSDGEDGDSCDSNYAASDGCHTDHSDFGSSDEAAASTSTGKPRVAAEKWICAQSSANKSGNLNEHITKKLQELATIYENTKDRWRALGYQKAIVAIRKHPRPISTFEEAKSIRGVGAKLAEKIWEIISSGELRKLNELSSSEDMKTLDLFTKLWGAGPTTALAWMRAGFTTLEDLRTKASLTRQQKIGLKYYDELLDRMPRQEAAEIEAVVKHAAHEINPGLICMACGSYRRGRATCGDVDVLVTHPDGKSHKGIFNKLLNSLRDTGFLTDDLVAQEEDGNQRKYLGVCLLPGENRKHRRLDIIVVPYDEFACALMYFTGSAHFNRSMRHLAGKMGMSLNEHSLNTGVVKVNNVKVNKGTPLPTPTEESVFEHLGLKYRDPVDRDHK